MPGAAPLLQPESRHHSGDNFTHVSYEGLARIGEPGQSQEITYGPQERRQSCLAFTQSDSFIFFTGIVICVNVAMVFLEEHDSELKHEWGKYESALLAFYVFEILARLIHLGCTFFCPLNWLAVWNIVDLVSVTAAILDQWILPTLSKAWRTSPMVSTCMRFLRFCRLLRVLRIGRVFVVMNLDWARSDEFESFIAVVIAFNAVVMGLETDVPWWGWYWIEQALLFIFLFELVVRFRGGGCADFFGFEAKGVIWNWMDFIIVTSGIIDQWMLPLFHTFDLEELSDFSSSGEKKPKGRLGHLMTLLRLLRLMRILRLLRLVKAVRPLFHLAMGVLAAMQGMFWVMVLTILLLYGFSILLTRLIGHGIMVDVHDENISMSLEHFSTVVDSMFTLFRVMNGDIHDVRPIFVESSCFRIIFVLFMMTSSWALLSILTAVVSDNMISVTQQQEKEIKEEEWQSTIQSLGILIQKLDSDGNGEIDLPELQSFMKVPENAAYLRKLKISPHDASDVWNALQKDGAVLADEYIEGLSLAIRPVSEKSVMRIEARLRNMERMGQFSDKHARQELKELRGVLQEQGRLLRKVATMHGLDLPPSEVDESLADDASAIDKGDGPSALSSVPEQGMGFQSALGALRDAMANRSSSSMNEGWASGRNQTGISLGFPLLGVGSGIQQTDLMSGWARNAGNAIPALPPPPPPPEPVAPQSPRPAREIFGPVFGTY